MRRMRFIAPAVIASLLAACSQPSPSPATPAATLALVNARVWTGEASKPTVEALAIAGNRIVAAGTGDEVRRASNVPGFIRDAKVTLTVVGGRAVSRRPST